MLNTLKALLVVLAIGGAVFHFTRPILLRFGDASDFVRRRNLWFAVTAAGFLVPNFWLFVLLASPMLFLGGQRDRNPVAFYVLMLQVVPPVPIDIPFGGTSVLFAADNYRLLAFCVLVPAAWRFRSVRSETGSRWSNMDYLLLGFGVLQTIFFIQPDLPGHAILPDSATNHLRLAFLFLLDSYVLYFAVSRSCRSRRAIAEVLATFWLSAMILGGIAIFETVRHWLLYMDILKNWTNGAATTFYLMRGTVLRAEASTGGSLSLGYILAIGVGFWLYLRSQVKSTATDVWVFALLGFGLIATYSRGPWLGVVLIYILFSALSSPTLAKLFKPFAGAALVAVGVGLTPLGARIVSMLPFMGGSVDVGNWTYRQALAERAWTLIKASPLFGDQLAVFKMQDLRQGMGIIDMTDTYAQMALDYGLVGLSLFLGFMLVGLVKTYRFANRIAKSDHDLAMLGFCIVACILGTLFMLADNSFIFVYGKMFYVLAGLAAGYARLERPFTQPVQDYRSLGEAR